jgi:hypothetical protein
MANSTPITIILLRLMFIVILLCLIVHTLFIVSGTKVRIFFFSTKPSGKKNTCRWPDKWLKKREMGFAERYFLCLQQNTTICATLIITNCTRV